MDPLRCSGTGQIKTQQKMLPPPKTEAKSVEPKVTDKVEVGSQGREPGLIHKTFRGMAKVAGGVVGTFIGAAKGTVKGGATEEVWAPTAKEIKVSRAMLAGAGVAAGLLVGITTGIPGLVLGPVVGGITGSAIGGGAAGVLDGAWAGIKGAFKGGRQGMKTGIEKGGKAMEWIVAKTTGSPQKPEQPRKA